MKILFLGGTQFVGLHMVEAALAKGYEVSLFNRGKTNADLFPAAEKIIGDRDGGLDALKGREWDVVIDVNGYVPRLVRDAAELLKDSVKQYVFVSTGSVYDFPNLKPYSDESAPLTPIGDEDEEEWAGPAYGYLKVLCENVVQEIYPDNSLILRLGVVAGPHDPTDRVTYWVGRVARGGEMLVPGAPDLRVQFVDARDLANFTILGIEKPLNGIYNTVGRSITWDHFLKACQDACYSDGTFTWVDDQQFLTENVDMRARQYGVIPMAVPPEFSDIMTIKSDKALDAGMIFRSTLNTVRDTLAWELARPVDEERVAGLTPEQEKELLEKWHARG